MTMMLIPLARSQKNILFTGIQGRDETLGVDRLLETAISVEYDAQYSDHFLRLSYMFDLAFSSCVNL